MASKYVDLLLVRRSNGTMTLLTAEAHQAEIGCIVEFGNGRIGRVVQKAWAGERGGELINLITSICTTYEAEASYYPHWIKEEDNGDTCEHP